MTNSVWNTEGDLLLKLYQVYLVRMRANSDFWRNALVQRPFARIDETRE